MSRDKADEFFRTYKSDIRERLRKQIERHARIDPHFDPVNIVDIQIGQEREKLEQMKDEFDEEGKDNMYEFADALVREWLPELAAEFKRSYGHRR